MTNSIFFKSPEHKRRLIEAMQHIGKIYGGKLDAEYAAALYVLTADLTTWRQAQDYVSRTGIDFEGMLEELYLSSGEEVLMKWAGNLFNEQQHIDPIETLRLDPGNFQLALDAIKIRRSSLQICDLKQ